MGEPPPARPAAERLLTPLVGRKKELADVLRLLDDGVPVTIVGPPGIGKTRFIEALIAEQPEARTLLREAREPSGDANERVYRLGPLAEAPAVELYRLLSGDDATPYAELVARTREVGRVPAAIQATIHPR